MHVLVVERIFVILSEAERRIEINFKNCKLEGETQTYNVYFLFNAAITYVGVTNNLKRRIYAHKNKTGWDAISLLCNIFSGSFAKRSG